MNDLQVMILNDKAMVAKWDTMSLKQEKNKKPLAVREAEEQEWGWEYSCSVFQNCLWKIPLFLQGDSPAELPFQAAGKLSTQTHC